MKVKLFAIFLDNISNKNNSLFNLRNNSVIGQIKEGFNNFNEVTIKLLAFSINKVLLNNTKSPIKILIANDGSHKYLSYFEKELLNLINQEQILTYSYEKNEPVSKAFLAFTNSITEAFTIIIYVHKYDEKNNFAISFFNKNVEPLNFELVKLFLKEYQNISIDMIKDKNNLNPNLDFQKILKEYTDFLLNKNFTNNANHLLKIGVINSPLQNSFVKKILGKNDIAYTILKNSFKTDKPQFLKYSLLNYSLLKNIEYIFKFSYDYQKVYLYKRNKNKKYFFYYELVDMTDLVSNYLSFINNYESTNNQFSEIKNVVCSHLTKKENIINIASRYKINLNFSWNFDSKKYPKSNLLFFDEDYQIYLDNNKNIKYDGFMFLNILIDMLNYYETQEMKYEDICKRNLDKSHELLINYFSFDCAEENLINFETKLYMQTLIAQIKISSIENVKENFKNIDEKYVAKFNFEPREWMAIKYNFKYKQLIFVIQENRKTKGNVAKKINRFMTKFTLKYNKPLIEFKKINSEK